ncbi:MAG: T9SS type A sorting domain-containing protein, partial [Chitinophagaceae bacterium]
TGSGVTAASTGQTLNISIIDDEDLLVLGENSVDLINESFETSSVNNWSTLSSTGAVNVFTVSSNGNAGGTGNAAHITRNTTTKPNTYNVAVAGVSVLRTPLIDARGYTNLRLKFKYAVYGEADDDGIYDYGMVLHTPASQPTSFSTNNSLGGLYYGEFSEVFGNPTLTSINELKGTSFYVGFYWENDDNLGNNPGLNIDDVVITGDPTKIETAISNSYAYGVSSNSAADNYFKSISNGKIIATVKSPSTNVTGIVAAITEAGNDRLNITSGSNNYLRSRKVIKVAPQSVDNTTQYTTTLYYTTNEVSAWAAATSLKVLKVQDGFSLSGNLNSSNATLLTPTVVDKRVTDGYISYTISTTGFGSFVLVDAATILPLTFTNFTGKIIQNAVELKWTTTNEVNTKSFDIEKSSDGGNTYSYCGSVPANNTRASNEYRFTDSKIDKGNRYYYRIKQVDIDGQFAYSSVINVLYVNSNQSVSVTPNPFKHQLSITNSLSGNNVAITITDMNGKLVYQKQFIPTGNTHIDTQHWSKGMYFIRINSATTVSVMKVVKE